MKLAFTGHRPESLPFGENENDGALHPPQGDAFDGNYGQGKGGIRYLLHRLCKRHGHHLWRLVMVVKATSYSNIRLIGVVLMKGRQTIGVNLGGTATLLY